MKRFAAFLLFASTTFAAGPARQPHALADSNLWLPTSANIVGRFGAHFRTRVSVLNPQSFGYQVSVLLHDSEGSGRTALFTLGAGEQKTWDDFLGSVFPGATSGALEFDSWHAVTGGSPSNQFIVSGIVYTDETGGRYGSSLPTLGIEDVSYNVALSYSPGIEVSAGKRTNVGCTNIDTSTSALFQAEVHAPDGSILGNVPLYLGPGGWSQNSVSFPVSNGYVLWRPQGYATAYCYAAVVENDSNDGSVIPATTVLP